MHRGISLSAALFFCLLAPGKGFAQTSNETAFTRCSDIQDDKDRLGCFDAAARQSLLSKAATQTSRTEQPNSAPTNTYQSMSLIDLKLDADKLRGKRISVSGNLLIFSNFAFIRRDPSDTTNMFIQLENVPRDQRRIILEQCTGLGCKATVQGVVATVLGRSGISAEQIIVDSE